MASRSQTVACLLSQGGIIAHQTDTVFGFACLPREHTLKKLTRIKQRAVNRGFILLATSTEQLLNYINCSTEEIEILNKPQHRPTTYLVQASEHLPPSLLGEHTKIAVRMVKHPCIISLCENVGAIASTSANISHQEICSQPEKLRTMFGPHIDYIETESIAGTGLASRIIDLASQEIIRA